MKKKQSTDRIQVKSKRELMCVTLELPSSTPAAQRSSLILEAQAKADAAERRFGLQKMLKEFETTLWVIGRCRQCFPLAYSIAERASEKIEAMEDLSKEYSTPFNKQVLEEKLEQVKQHLKENYQNGYNAGEG